MKFKNAIPFLLAKTVAVCLIALVMFSSFASAMIFTTDGVKVDNDGALTKISTELKNINGYNGNVSLIVASQNKINGKISDIKVDTKEVDSFGNVSLSASVSLSDGEEAVYYIVDENGSSVKNAPPGNISNLSVKTKSDSATLSWDAAADDNDSVQYIIYNDGTECGRTSDTSYTIEGLSKGQEYTFGVEAADHMGLLSTKAEIKATAVNGMTLEQAAEFADYYAVNKYGQSVKYKNLAASLLPNKSYFDDNLYYMWQICSYGNNDVKPHSVTFKPTNVTENINKDYTIYILASGSKSGDMLYIYDGDNPVSSPNDSLILYNTWDLKNPESDEPWQMYKLRVKDWDVTADEIIGFNKKAGNINLREVYIFDSAKVTDEIDAAMLGKEVPDAKIFIASDSIAAQYNSGSVVGWGMEFKNYIADNAELVNLAYPGSSTVSFPNKTEMFESVGSGDYVLICFGHNDSMTDSRGVPLDEYKENLKDYINKTVERGATPIILTSIPQFNSSANKMVYNEGEALMAYRKAALEVADEMGIESFDSAYALNDAFEKAKLEDEDAAKAEFNDMYADEGWANRTHLTQSGAELLAELIAKGLYNNPELESLHRFLVVK